MFIITSVNTGTIVLVCRRFLNICVSRLIYKIKLYLLKEKMISVNYIRKDERITVDNMEEREKVEIDDFIKNL